MFRPRTASTSVRSLLATQTRCPSRPFITTPHALSQSNQDRRPPSTSSNSHTDDTTHFGFQDVPSSSKESLVANVFSSVASSYDLMNDAMSLGIHRLWKNHFVSKLDPRGGISVLDVAGGTGDIGLRILDHARLNHIDRDIKVTMLDINPEMLREGMVRFKRDTMYWNTPQLNFQLGNAESLDATMEVPLPKKRLHKTLPELVSKPIESESIDLYTIAFGIRNCTHIDKVLQEAHRVLKPGGVFACLEFGKVNNPLLKEVYKQYSFQLLPSLGQLLASDRQSYQYLVESIERFPTQPQFANMMKNAGFTLPGTEAGRAVLAKNGLNGEDWYAQQGEWEDLTGGIATIWTGVKL
ncbi:unnamed protein product [Sympodiomycopsis kandeliae]